MKTYTLNDLKPLPNAESLIRKKPTQYINNPESPSLDIASHLMSDALALSVNTVIVNKVDDWYLVSASKDWVRHNIENIQDLSVIFSRLISIPEKGLNSFRGEILVFTFSQDCFVYDNDKLHVLKGSKPSKSILQKLLSSAFSFSVGFRV